MPSTLSPDMAQDDTARAAVPAWSRISLQSQLVAITVILLVGSLALLAVTVERSMRGQLVAQADSQLSQLITNSRLVRDSDDRYGPRANSLRNNPFSSYVVIVKPQNQSAYLDRRSLEVEASTEELDRIVSQAPQKKSGPRDITRGYNVSLDGERYRAMAGGNEVPPGFDGTGTFQPEQDATVVVMQNLSTINGPVDRVRNAMALIGLALALMSAALGFFAIRRAFRPLRQVEEAAEAISEGDLSRRVPAYPPSTEVGRLTQSLNVMLNKIESAFRAREASEARTKRFAADASHELRTPLASIRGYAELYRQGAVPTDEVPRAMRRIEDEAKRMGGLVEDLLLLARLDEQRPIRQDGVDLLVIANDAVQDAKPLDPERVVTLTGLNGAGPTPAPVVGDEDRLRQVVANLVGNAVRHTPAGSPIEVAVGRRDGASVIEVRDHGPGLSAEQAEKVFERFYRADASRQRGKGGGAGLGLSIVQAVVTAHGGAVQAIATPGGGATFVVALPTPQ